MTKTTPLLEAALGYTERGWKVFPLEEMAKTPRVSVKDGGKGVHDATTDKSQIETWWARFPNANLGVHCEKFWVLDVDPKHNGPASLDKLIETYGPLPETLVQNTPSGGKHYLFKSPLGVLIKNRSGFHPGLDTRAYGGYIVVAPSETDNGFYGWANEGTPIADPPDWLIGLVSDKREGYKQSKRSDSGSRDVDDASMAGYLLNGGFTEEQITKILMDRNNDPQFRDIPLPTSEILKTVKSICKRDVHTPAGLRQAIQDNSNRVKAEHLIAVKPDVMWEDRLITTTTGLPKNIVANVVDCLSHSPLLYNSVAYNEFSAEVRLSRDIVDPINNKPVGHLVCGAIVDEHIAREMLVLTQRLLPKLSFTEEIFTQGISVVARQNAFHPVQKYLNALIWDETPRMDTWLIDHFGVLDDAEGYARGIGRRWLISAVGRAIKPGCKADCALIIEGPQGIGKSPALATLAGQEWFKDSPIDFNSKDKFSNIRGTWIYELAEFDQYKGHDAAVIKSFLSSQYDTYRPAYGRSDVKQPRGLVFAGTTNADKYLVDLTGNKRFWPVRSVRHSKANPIDLKKLADARDQIWAEATRAYYNGEAGFIDIPDLMAAHENQALNRHDMDDTWEDAALAYIKSHESRRVLTSDILQHAIGIPLGRQSSREQARLKKLLEYQGYEYINIREKGKQSKTWRKKTPLL